MPFDARGGATVVYLVRHGETDWNARGVCQGTLDVPLNARGRSELARLADRLARVRFDAAYTSPLGRARHTAEAVLAGRGLRAAPWAAFTELSYGESLDDVHRRIAPAWTRLVEAHTGETVLLAAHGHLNRVLLIHALGWPRARFWHIAQPNAGCVIVRVPLGGGMRVTASSPERSAAGA